jgi:hypothetical protein
MPKYRVSGYLTITVTAEIEADSAAEAKAKGLELQAPGLCYHCEAAGGDEGEWQLGGFDDPPDDSVQSVVEISVEDEEVKP